MRKQTWLACVVCVLGVLPGFLVGGVAKIFYRVITAFQVGTEPDFYMMRTLFGFEAPGAIMKWIIFFAIPLAIQGGVAGAVAMMATYLICKGSRYEIAAFVTGGLYTGILITSIIGVLAAQGFDMQMAGALCQIAFG